MSGTPRAEATPPPLATSGGRVEAVDLLRGLAMVVMVLDHLREYLTDATLSPTDLDRASPALFLTRWVTHFCAPMFALLAGVGARLAAGRGPSPGSTAGFLATRGLWLILLEETVVKFGLFFRFDPAAFIGLVLWSIGGSFVILAGFVAARTAPWVVGAIGLAIVFGHNALDAFPPGTGGPVAQFLLRPSGFELPLGISGFVGYPLLPWFGVVALGYWLGALYEPGRERRRAWLVTLGLAAIGLFAVLRGTGVYGDPSRWTPAGDATRTALAFVNCTKYPPSLQFLLMTLGPALLALAAFDRGAGRWGGSLARLGRAPLAFYLLQWYVVHGMAWALAVARGEPTSWLFVDTFPILPPASFAYGLPGLYLAWIAALAILWPICGAFAGYKARHRGSRWLSYF